MFFHPKSMKSENNNPWFKAWFNILLHTQSIVWATVDSQCLEKFGYITLVSPSSLLAKKKEGNFFVKPRQVIKVFHATFCWLSIGKFESDLSFPVYTWKQMYRGLKINYFLKNELFYVSHSSLQAKKRREKIMKPMVNKVKL